MQVQFNPAVLAPGDTADIVLRKRNEDGSLESFPDSTLFDVQILDSFQYGTIYSPDSEDTSDFFFGLPQGFQFIARDSLNNDSAFVPVIVNTSGGIITATPLINPGMGNKIKDQRLKKKEEMRSRIVRADEQQRNRKTLPFSEERSHIEVVNTGSNVNPVIEGIESGDYSMGIGEVLVISELVNINILFSDSVLSPLINADNKNNPNYNANGPDKRKKIIDSTKLRKTNLTVYITDVNNNPIENYSFTIKALVRPKSGGHNHNNNRPIGKFITPEKDTISVYNGKTDTSGQAQYIYLCSGFGGVDSIFVQGKTEKDTSSAILTIKIKELQLLADGDHYNLVGETTTHPINHYGTSNLNSILITLADTAYADSTYILQYNDMNLINGGPFDINSNWDTPHQTHREGSNVDMRTWSADQEGRVLDKRYIKKLVRKFHGKLLDEGNHFHLTF